MPITQSEMEERIIRLEETVKKITALLQLPKLAGREISETVNNTTANYLKNLAERGVLTESSQETVDSTQKTH